MDAGEACVAFHNETVRNVKAERVQVDEISQFCYAKAKNVETAKAAPEGAGDTWTWTEIDADSKLIVAARRLAARVQLTSDGLRVYEGAVEDAFGADVDYAQLIKVFGDPRGYGRALQPRRVQGHVHADRPGRA